MLRIANLSRFIREAGGGKWEIGKLGNWEIKKVGKRRKPCNGPVSLFPDFPISLF
jgi:hypothetical protein